MSNRLREEQSPYLLQHKDNPVDWWAWSDEAFEAAAEQDKPIFLSIGYSTCHWCHVMAHESFEDEDVARLMNEAFINVKVDREERPDIDAIYMAVCQMLTGQGGWPLTLLMTPEKKPFFAATYIPKFSRYGRLGMLDLIPRLQHVWTQQRPQVEQDAARITQVLVETAGKGGAERTLDRDALHLAYAQLKRRFDPGHGGFGTAPKFPAPHNLLFLLRYWKRIGEEQALRMVETTLRHMRLGGVYDHVGFGFHRYSTDATWKLPHFEKMLYDQAMIALAYVEAYLATGKAEYERTVREIITYVLRDMTAPGGGFYAAEDADSEGREGTFYLWTLDEVRDVLGDALARRVIPLFNMEPGGNFEEEATRQRTGENILYLKKPIDEQAGVPALEADALTRQWEEARSTLFAHREQRIHPGKDDKILVDWNGLMIACLARAARAFDDASFADAAQQAARFILSTMRRKDGRLLHRYRDGDAAIPGTLDDYAFLTWGLLELYETTFDTTFLTNAIELTEHGLAHFWDNDHGAFFISPDDGEALIVRWKEAYDSAVPSGNSVMMMNLLRLSRMTGRVEWEEKAEKVGRFFAEAVRQHPAGFTALLTALDFGIGPSFEVVIAGDPAADDTQAMLRGLRSTYVPHKVVLFRPTREETQELARVAPFTAAQHALDGAATAYVCRHFRCEQPTTDIEQMIALLNVTEK
ncbi:MAG: thioredoxin domain-containing protein [Rhodothermales bacterium]